MWRRILSVSCMWMLVLSGACPVGADSPPGPDKMLLGLYQSGGIQQGRKQAATIAAFDLETWRKVSISALDKTALEHWRRPQAILEIIPAWVSAEGWVFRKSGKLDTDFQRDGWEPQFKALGQAIDAINLAKKQCQTLLDKAPTPDKNWLAERDLWQKSIEGARFRMAVLAKFVGKPDLVQQVFDLGGTVDKNQTVAEFLRAEHDAVRLLNIPSP